jgi:hypothetical protein
MFKSRRFGTKIGGQGSQDVASRIISTNFTKFLIIFYGLIKMTTGCYSLASEPERKIREIRTVYPPGSNHTQCYNMPSGHKFSLKISTELPKLNMIMNTTVVASVLEEHFHYVYLYEEFIVEKIRRMDFAFNKRTQIYLASINKDNNRKILIHLAPYIAMLIIIGKIFGYKTVLLIIFMINLIHQAEAKKPTTIQSLHNTLLYIRFRINYNWLSSGFREKQYHEMEAGLVDAIIQLQQLATPPPPKPTLATKIPMFQSNDERIHSILHSFVNKTLNKQAEEKEETPNASGLTKQQEMIYATE